ncbi:MAG: hypothetical protein NXY57DRAFT_157330 [Lentinula lateritia]|nr:MAG: hypothetical protein NXY57DRAFT_157330 [Lentinula lateritia]
MMQTGLLILIFHEALVDDVHSESSPSYPTRRVQNRSPQLSTSSQRFSCPEGNSAFPFLAQSQSESLRQNSSKVYRALTVGFFGSDHLSIFISVHLSPSEWDCDM